MHRRTFALLPFLGSTSVGAADVAGPLVVAVEFALPTHAADWVTREIATPFERAFGTLPGLASMKSVSSATGCLIELGYAGNPTPQALRDVRKAARATRGALGVSIPAPSVEIREAQLT